MPSVLIVGGGYAGVRAASTLAHGLETDWRIVLVSDSLKHDLITRIPEIVGGRIAAEQARIPLVDILPRRVELVEGTGVRLSGSECLVETASEIIEADRMIVATGTALAVPAIPVANERGIGVRSIDGAWRLRQALSRLAETHGSVNVVVVGSGYTATEIAAELTVGGTNVDKSNASPLTVTMIAPEEGLLHDAAPHLGLTAQKRLEARNVRMNLETTVTSVSIDRVETSSGNSLPADIVAWATSTRVPSWVGRDFVVRKEDQRILVDPYLRPSDFSHIYVVGDSALAYDYRRGEEVAGRAQMAVAQGELAARNIIAEVRGHPPAEFRTRSLGEAISLGPTDGVAEIAGVVVTGRAAAAIKRAALRRYLWSLGGMALVARHR